MRSMFLSYSRLDIEVAEVILEIGLAEQLDLWCDLKDIPLTADWFSSIQEGLAASQAVLLLASQSSLQSRVVQLELEYAIRQKIQIQLLLIDNVELPPDLLNYQQLFVADIRVDPLSRDLISSCLRDLDRAQQDSRIGISAIDAEPKLPTYVSSLLRHLRRHEYFIPLFCIPVLLSAFPASKALRREPNLWLLVLGVALGVVGFLWLRRIAGQIRQRRLGSSRFALYLPSSVALATAGVSGLAILSVAGGLLNPVVGPLTRNPVTLSILFTYIVVLALGFALPFAWYDNSEFRYLEKWLPRLNVPEVGAKAFSALNPSHIHTLERATGTRSKKFTQISILHHPNDRKFALFLYHRLTRSLSMHCTAFSLSDAQWPHGFASLDPIETVVVLVVSPFLIDSLKERNGNPDLSFARHVLVPVLFQTTLDLGLIGRLQWIDARKCYGRAAELLVERLAAAEEGIVRKQNTRQSSFLDSHILPPGVIVSFGLTYLGVGFAGLLGVILSAFNSGWPTTLLCALYALGVGSFFFRAYWKRTVGIRMIRWVSWLTGAYYSTLFADLLLELAMRFYNFPLSVAVFGLLCLYPGLGGAAFFSSGFLKFMGADFEELLIWAPEPESEKWSIAAFAISTVIFLAAGLTLRGWKI